VEIPGCKEQVVHWIPTPLASLSKSSERYCGHETTILEGRHFETKQMPQKIQNSPLAFLVHGQSPNVLTLVFQGAPWLINGHENHQTPHQLNQWHPQLDLFLIAWVFHVASSEQPRRVLRSLHPVSFPCDRWFSLSQAAMPKLCPQTKGHSEASGMGENHRSQGKGALGGETLKTLLGCSEEATWNTQRSEKIKLGCHGSTGEEFGGSHDHYISHGAPWKTKVSTFGD